MASRLDAHDGSGRHDSGNHPIRLDGPDAAGDTIVPHRANVERFAAEGECLLYNPARDEASALNRSATEIWELCDGRLTIGAIARVLGERYPGRRGVVCRGDSGDAGGAPGARSRRAG